MSRYENCLNGSNFKENQIEPRLLINPCYGNFENNECESRYSLEILQSICYKFFLVFKDRQKLQC
jgi:hypothetical protein